jgi:hypothetical protein
MIHERCGSMHPCTYIGQLLHAREDEPRRLDHPGDAALDRVKLHGRPLNTHQRHHIQIRSATLVHRSTPVYVVAVSGMGKVVAKYAKESSHSKNIMSRRFANRAN